MGDKQQLDRTPVPYYAKRIIANNPGVLNAYLAAGWYLAQTQTCSGEFLEVRKDHVWDATKEGANETAKHD